jgi:hypothetical protein
MNDSIFFATFDPLSTLPMLAAFASPNPRHSITNIALSRLTASATTSRAFAVPHVGLVCSRNWQVERRKSGLRRKPTCRQMIWM